MPGLFARWLITTIAIMIVPYVISGVQVSGIWSALFAAAILGILNALVRPLLIILTLPITVFTLGLFILVINALMFQLVGAIVGGLQVASFWSAFFASIIVSIVSWFLNAAIAGPNEGNVIIGRRSGVVDMHRGSGGRWE